VAQVLNIFMDGRAELFANSFCDIRILHTQELRTKVSNSFIHNGVECSAPDTTVKSGKA